MDPLILHKYMNKLYNHAFWLYKPLYYLYKRASDKMIFSILKKQIRKGDCIIDIGANIGIYTKFFSKYTGDNGSVYAFEPDITNFNHLLATTTKCLNVQAYNMALSDRCGTIELYHSDDLNVDHRTYSVKGRPNPVKVHCTTVDHILRDKSVRCIKMDIQGYEFVAFQGMTEVLTNNQNIFIIMELWPYGLGLNGYTCSDIEQFLTMHGFKMSIVTNSKLVTYSETLLTKDEYHYYTLLAEKRK